MARHEHADLIHAWAEGAEIQYKNCSGEWVNVGSSPRFITSIEYRVKPKEPEWCKNIPEHGVLISYHGDREVYVVFQDDLNDIDPALCVPLTNEEIERFKR